MKNSFRGFFSPDKDSILKLWEESIFVLDANVLLNFYRFSEQTCDELFDVFSSLSDRLWVPHQVAQEYFNNRLGVISDQVKVYDDSIKSVKTFQGDLEDSKRHPFVSSNVLEKVVSVFKELLDEFQANRQKHDVRVSDDEIKERVGLLLNGKVGPAYSREELEKIILDGASRYEQKIPPGYKDLKKGGDSLIFADRCKPFGDYIVWKQIIDKACEDKRPVIFITNDAKEDWWLRHSGKSIGPHPALIEEFFSSSGHDFYMYTQLNFLKRANEFLDGKVSVSTVDEVREAEAVDVENELIDFEKELNIKLWHMQSESSSGPGPESGAVPIDDFQKLKMERNFAAVIERVRSLDYERARLHLLMDDPMLKNSKEIEYLKGRVTQIDFERDALLVKFLDATS